MKQTVGSGLSSVGNHFALTTTTVLVVVLTLVFAELTVREQTRSLDARRSAAEIVTVLFANSSSAAMEFDDAHALTKEIANVEATPGVIGAALFHEGDSVPVAASSKVGACAALPAGTVDIAPDQLAAAQPILGIDGNLLGRACVVFSLEEENRAFRATRRLMTIRGFIAALAIATLIIFVSRRKVIRPLLKLVDMATSIERGETRTSATVESTDELGQLARAFNRMGEAVADREERLRAELDTAARLQLSILPQQPSVPSLLIATVMETASEVGGDYYDVIPVHDGCWFGIGDVSGHGLGAGVIMLMIQSAVGALVRDNPDASPRDVECIVNRLIHENVRKRMARRDHATLSLLRYEDSGRIRFAGAHEDILILRSATNEIEWVETPGTWIGAVAAIESATEVSTIQLEQGDVMVLYTDGVTEAFRGREQFGIDRLAASVRAHGAATVEGIRDAVMADVKAWMTGELKDDISLVVVKHVGLSAARATSPVAIEGHA